MKYYFDHKRKVDVVKIADNITIVSWQDKLNEEQAEIVALGLQEIAKKLEPNWEKGFNAKEDKSSDFIKDKLEEGGVDDDK
tara:strand:+ start:260 stop:502 length:243 start_codon:yes stop_codon:yes gene_type:complete